MSKESSTSRSDNAEGETKTLTPYRTSLSFLTSATNSCTPAAAAEEHCLWVWQWGLLWWQQDRCPSSQTSCHKLGRRGVQKSASRWCCPWRWSQRIQNLEERKWSKRSKNGSILLMTTLFVMMLPNLKLHKEVNVTQRLTELFCQQSATIHWHHSLLIHITFISS